MSCILDSLIDCIFMPCTLFSAYSRIDSVVQAEPALSELSGTKIMKLLNYLFPYISFFFFLRGGDILSMNNGNYTKIQYHS